MFYCIKAVYRYVSEDSFLREVRVLAESDRITNVIPFFGVVEADTGLRRIDGMVLKYIAGTVCLSDIISATLMQKNEWNQQIAGAVGALHEAELVWGDAKADNILIDGETNDAVLVGFLGGYTNGRKDGLMQS